MDFSQSENFRFVFFDSLLSLFVYTQIANRILGLDCLSLFLSSAAIFRLYCAMTNSRAASRRTTYPHSSLEHSYASLCPLYNEYRIRTTNNLLRNTNVCICNVHCLLSPLCIVLIPRSPSPITSVLLRLQSFPRAFPSNRIYV